MRRILVITIVVWGDQILVDPLPMIILSSNGLLSSCLMFWPCYNAKDDEFDMVFHMNNHDRKTVIVKLSIGLAEDTWFDYPSP